ncbi:hypothetical protein [Wandonia haliotis]|uniref:hypothetical protein n=1 Tax=Wandonia haliotis TaxID=574963 RepID=UPI0031CEA7FA
MARLSGFSGEYRSGRALEDHFNTKRGVYHNATMNLPCENSLSEKELDLIERFDPDFGNSLGFR